MTAADLGARLELVLLEVRAVHALLERRRAAPPDDDGAGLLLALARAFGDSAFTCSDAFAHATVDADLRAALATAGVPSARRLGKRWPRLADQDLAGLRLLKIGDSRDGAVLRLLRL